MSVAIFANHSVATSEIEADVQASAVRVVTSLHEALVAVMMANAKFAQRYKQLKPVIEVSFDAPLISKISIGRAWRQLDSQQQEMLTQLIAELVTSTYANRFKSFNDQVFKIVNVRSSSRGPIITARIILRDDDPVTLDYHLHKNKIYNVVANGVSDLSLKRADYAAVIASSGIEGLLQKIRINIDLNRNADS